VNIDQPAGQNQLPPLFFTGRKLRPLGIGIEATGRLELVLRLCDRLIAGFPLVVGCDCGGNVTAVCNKLELSRGFEVKYRLLSDGEILCSEAGVILCRSVSRAWDFFSRAADGVTNM
jgi:hypothetical protein